MTEPRKRPKAKASATTTGDARVRVLNAHRDAALTAIRANASLAAGDPDELGDRVAQAVLTAIDTKAEYVLVTVTASGQTVVYGPYASRETAVKAAGKGIAIQAGQRLLDIVPLLRAPR